MNNTDQNGSTNNATASENIESDSQPAVQNGCVQSDSTEPIQGGSSDIPLQKGCKRDSLRQSIAVHQQNYDESYQQYESETGDEEDQEDKGDVEEADGWEPEDQIARKKDVLQVQLHRFQQTRDSWLLKLLVSKKGFLINEDIHAIYVGKVLTCRSPLPCIMQRNIQMILFNGSTAHTVLSPNGLFRHQHSHLYLKHVCDICEKCFQFPGQLQWHSKIHTGSGLFPCLHCDKKCTLTVQCLSMPSHIM